MTYDLIVIGSGIGGYVGAIRASQLGMKVAIVERAELGGICLNWGCIPTKALLKSAQVFEYLKHSKDYGINVNGGEVDFGAVVKRSRSVADGMSKGVQFLMRKNKIDIIKGFGKLKAGKKVEVTNDNKVETYDAKNIIVAVGARSRELPSLKIDGKKIIGYRDAMVLPSLPKSMVIVGSGAIGSEFAYFYATMGTKVTLVEMLPDIVPVEDEEVSKTLLKSFTKLGIDVRSEASVKSVEISGTSCKVRIKDAKEETDVECDVVLSAVGIVSNLENIGLEDLGVITDKGKILVNAFYQTNIPGIHAIGDCVGGQALAHVASAEGIICVEKMTGQNPEPLNYNNIPGCTYCQPEIASVGYTEKQAKAAGYELKIGKFPFLASGKASAVGAKDGFVKLIFDAKYGELLGAHMIGYNVTEMIAEIVVARKLETTAHEMIKSVHPHPTMSEAIMQAAAAAYGEATDI